MKHVIAYLKAESYFGYIYLSSFLLAFQYALIVYINSSFLATFVSEKQIGLVYIIGAILNVFIMLNISKLLRKFGNWKLALSLILIEGFSLLALAYGKSALFIIPIFLIHQSIGSLITFNLDIFLETGLKTNTHVGGARGIFLTMANLAFVFSPFIGGLILKDNNFTYIYLASLLFLLPVFAILFKKFKHFKDPHYLDLNFKKNIKAFFSNKNLKNIYISSFILQVFYACAVIYIPIYLHLHKGFSWPDIGQMLSIALLPFIFFQIPGGLISDTSFGEKKLLVAGFIVLGLSTLTLPFLGNQFAYWTIMLFVTRVGASIVEIMNESYFFKHVKGKDSNIISVFRTAGPLATIITPIIVGALFLFTNFNSILFLLGIFILFGIGYADKIEEA